MSDTIRTFIAIKLPQTVVTYLSDYQTSTAGSLPQKAVRWVKPQNMHLTMRFLGDTPQSKIADVVGVMDSSAESHPHFNLQLGKTGCFPNAKRPRVFWAGLQGAVDSAEKLKQSLDTQLIPLGWEPEQRSFKPHLTLGYIKDHRNLRGVPLSVDVELSALDIPVTDIHLFRSDLHPSGPIYTILHTSLLR